MSSEKSVHIACLVAQNLPEHGNADSDFIGRSESAATDKIIEQAVRPPREVDEHPEIESELVEANDSLTTTCRCMEEGVSTEQIHIGHSYLQQSE